MTGRYRAYPEYKDSGVEWLGEVPARWEVRKFKHCCFISEGQVDPEEKKYQEWPLIAPNHIESGTGRLLQIESAWDQGAISGKYLVYAGEIIYSKIRPALNKLCVSPEDCLCSADMYPVRVIAHLELRFLFYFMLSDLFVLRMTNESMRVAMPKVAQSRMGRRCIHHDREISSVS